MAKRKRIVKSLPTIWQVPDELWAIIQPILAELDPPPKTGRPRTRQREALNGIIYILRSGSQWNQLPRYYGDDSSVHRTLQRWVAKGVFQRIWAVLIESCQELGGVNWQWQSADCSMGKARFGGDRVGPNPTDRAKNGTKRSLIVEADGGPLGGWWPGPTSTIPSCLNRRLMRSWWSGPSQPSRVHSISVWTRDMIIPPAMRRRSRGTMYRISAASAKRRRTSRVISGRRLVAGWSRGHMAD